MRKIWSVLISVFLLSSGFMPMAQATEPELEFPLVFNTVAFPKMIQNETWKYKCTTNWDPTSKKTEIIARCSKANSEIYMHGNASPTQGSTSSYNQGNVSYLSFTVKKADLYSNFEYFGGEMCASAVMGADPSKFKVIQDWLKKNYKSLANKKKLTKVFNGHSMSIIGGVGPIRTVTCGATPS